MTTTYSVTTDLNDYAPGATAYISSSGFQAGSAVTFRVQHVSGPGADGVYGTLDDEVVVLGGAGHDPWTIIDGGSGDADGLANGSIQTSWYVNPDDSLDETFLLTASGNGWITSNTFTDGKKLGEAVAASPTEANFAKFIDYQVPDSTGTGVINSFLRMQDNNISPGFEAGYNTDGRPVQFNEDTSAQNNFGLRYIEVPKVTIEGVTYLVLNLDLNESNANDPNADLITLQNIKIFTASTGNLTNMDTSTRLFPTATLRYELDIDTNHDGDALDAGETDNFTDLTDWNKGSGTGDYQVLIPVAGDSNNLGFAGVQPSAYFYIYSEFGTKNGTGYAADGGFEEWFVVKSSSMSIDKTATVNGGNLVTAVGDVIHYNIVVTNTGSEALTSVTVSDPYVTDMTYVSGDLNTNNVLDVLEVWTYSASHTVTAAEFYSLGGGDGHLENTATADSAETDPVSDSAIVDIQEVRSLAIDKTGTVPGGTANVAGETITYTYVVTNTGNAAIANVVVRDDNATPGNTGDDFNATYVSGDTDGDSLLDVTESWNYTSTRNVTQDMLDAGADLTNLATATGDGATPDTDDATIDVVQAKSLAIDKTGTVPGGTANVAGETITYTYVVTNTGNAAIANVVVRDDNATPGNTGDDFNATYVSGDTDGDSLLDVTESWNYTSTRNVTQDMLDAGADLTNLATATGDGATPDTDDATIDVVQAKSLAIDKTGSVPGGTANVAGETITYTYVVTNTGNAAIANVVVRDDNATPGNTGDDFNATYVSGDTDGDSLLDVTESWNYTSTRNVTQDMLDAGADLTNLATATGDGATPDTDDATIDVEQRPDIEINKITIYGSNSGDGLTGVIAGNAITWQYAVSNTGNTALSDVDVSDDNGTPGDATDDFNPSYVSGDTDSDGKLDVTETWIFEEMGTAVVGTYQNLGTATGTAGGMEVDDSDASSYTATAPGALIAPTGTTPLQYINGTAMTFQDYYAYQGGDIQYGVKSGKINQTNPGVFFYFTGASGDIKDGDNDNVIDTIQIKVDQARTVSSINPFYPLNNSNIQLYKVIDNGDSTVGVGDSLVAVKPATTISINKNALSSDFGDLTVSFKPEAEGTMYVLSVKYSTASAVGATVGTSPGAWPTSHYDFSTYVNSVFSETYAAGVDLAPKPVSPMMLDGEEGDGAMAIRASQARAAYKAALSWWSEQGFDVSSLKKPMVQVADLGEQDGQWLLGMTQDGVITIDDDAANHGWSLGKGKVVADKVDLMSVMVHEVGHLLGMSHEEMGESLEVGVRSLPTMDEVNDDQVGLVGTQMQQGEILFG